MGIAKSRKETRGGRMIWIILAVIVLFVAVMTMIEFYSCCQKGDRVNPYEWTITPKERD